MHVTERVVPPNPSFPYPGCVFQTSPNNIFLISWWVAISTKGNTTVCRFFLGRIPTFCIAGMIMIGLWFRWQWYSSPKKSFSLGWLSGNSCAPQRLAGDWPHDISSIKAFHPSWWPSYEMAQYISSCMSLFSMMVCLDCSAFWRIAGTSIPKITPSILGQYFSVALLVSTVFNSAVKGPIQEVPLV